MTKAIIKWYYVATFRKFGKLEYLISLYTKDIPIYHAK